MTSKVDFEQSDLLKQTMRYEKFYTTNPFEENSYDMIESLASYERRKYKIVPDYETMTKTG